MRYFAMVLAAFLMSGCASKLAHDEGEKTDPQFSVQNKITNIRRPSSTRAQAEKKLTHKDLPSCLQKRNWEGELSSVYSEYHFQYQSRVEYRMQHQPAWARKLLQ